MPRHLNLRTKLFLMTACTVLIPLSIFSFFAYRTSSKAVTAAFRNEQISTVKKAGVTTDNVLSEIEKTSLLVTAISEAILTENPPWRASGMPTACWRI